MKLKKILENIHKKDLEFREKRACWEFRKIKNLFPKNSKILNIGAGDCLISEIIEKDKNSKIINLDISDTSKNNQKVVIYNGKKIPFKKNQFDYSLLLHVLHHFENQEEMIKEVSRISKKIIVFEDKQESFVQKMHIKIMHLFWNLFQKGCWPVYCKYPHEWETFFRNHNLKIKKTVYIEKYLDKSRIGNVIYVLSKK